MDIQSISAIMSSIKTASDIATIIRNSKITLDDAEGKLKIAELIGALADAKMEAATIQEELARQARKIQELESALQVRRDLTWEPPLYVRNKDDGQKDLFCQVCFDSKSSLSRIHIERPGAYRCRVCSSYFETEERRRIDNQKVRELNSRNEGW